MCMLCPLDSIVKGLGIAVVEALGEGPRGPGLVVKARARLLNEGCMVAGEWLHVAA